MKYGGKSDFLRFSKKAYENNFQGNHFHPNQLRVNIFQIVPSVDKNPIIFVVKKISQVNLSSFFP